MSFNFFLFTSLHPSDLLSIPWPMCLVLYFQHLFSKYNALISGYHHYRNKDSFDEVSKDDDQTQGKWTFCKDPKMRKCIKGYFFIHLRNTDVRAAKNESHLVPDENWEKAGPGLKLKEMWSEEACSCQRRLSTLGLVPSNIPTSKTLWALWVL